MMYLLKKNTEDSFTIYISNHTEDQDNLQDIKKIEYRSKVVQRRKSIL